MMINAMKVPVAFQMICQTTGISLQCTTPLISANNAPNVALQPTPRPFGLPDHQGDGQQEDQ